jgi:hypothetical protein
MTFSFDIFVSVKTTLSVTIVLHKQLELWGTCGESNEQAKLMKSSNKSKESDVYSNCLPPIIIHNNFAVISFACICLVAAGIVTIAIPKHTKPWQTRYITTNKMKLSE